MLYTPAFSFLWALNREKANVDIMGSCGATPKHHNVGKARCVRVQLRRLQSGQISPMTKSSRISHMFSNY